jgi:hypothetical protein
MVENLKTQWTLDGKCTNNQHEESVLLLIVNRIDSLKSENLTVVINLTFFNNNIIFPSRVHGALPNYATF